MPRRPVSELRCAGPRGHTVATAQDGDAGAAAFPFLALFFPIAVICVPVVRPWCRRLQFDDDFTSSKLWCCFPPKNTEDVVVREEKVQPVVVIFVRFVFSFVLCR